MGSQWSVTGSGIARYGKLHRKLVLGQVYGNCYGRFLVKREFWRSNGHCYFCYSHIGRRRIMAKRDFYHFGNNGTCITSVCPIWTRKPAGIILSYNLRAQRRIGHTRRGLHSRSRGKSRRKRWHQLLQGLASPRRGAFCICVRVCQAGFLWHDDVAPILCEGRLGT